MYAIVEINGQQFKAEAGKKLFVHHMQNVEAGATVEFDKVLAVADGANVKLGAPYVDGGKVTAEILKQGRADKVTITKFRRRKHFQKVTGHRQWFTEVKITGINA